MNVALTRFRLSQVGARISPVLVKERTDTEALPATLPGCGVAKIGFLLLDHINDRYLSNLRD